MRQSSLIMGRNCIAEVLKASPERIFEVYTCQKPGGDKLYEALKKQKIRLIPTPKNELSRMVASDSHQSYVAKVKERSFINIKDFLTVNRTQCLILMLDSIYDPQNFGAILRAAECFGVDLVIYSKNRGTDLTPVVSKTSAGASELLPLCKVSNLHDAMKVLQKEDYWIVSTDIGPKIKRIEDFAFPEKTVLIMGSEGKGIQPILKKNSDFHVYVPMYGKIDSLNVSQATAVFLSFYRNFFRES